VGKIAKVTVWKSAFFVISALKLHCHNCQKCTPTDCLWRFCSNYVISLLVYPNKSLRYFLKRIMFYILQFSTKLFFSLDRFINNLDFYDKCCKFHYCCYVAIGAFQWFSWWWLAFFEAWWRNFESLVWSWNWANLRFDGVIYRIFLWNIKQSVTQGYKFSRNKLVFWPFPWN